VIRKNEGYYNEANKQIFKQLKNQQHFFILYDIIKRNVNIKNDIIIWHNKIVITTDIKKK